MKIDKDTLQKIAHLARLEFDEKDTEKMMQDMTNMVNSLTIKKKRRNNLHGKLLIQCKKLSRQVGR